MTSEPTVAILAGGLATRLGELVANTPKALLPVEGKPFLAWQLELLARYGIRAVTLCLGHQAERVLERLPALTPPGMGVRVSLDGRERLGTGGALARALPQLSDPFLVLYGDSYLRCDYRLIHRHFVQQQLPSQRPSPLALMTVFRNDDQFDASNVVYEEGRILAYSKQHKLPEMHHIDWGLGVLSHAAFATWSDRDPFDLAELYAQLVASDALSGYEVHERFYEIGSPGGLAEFRAWAALHSHVG
jgi:MurNAc alpha-1-phosphate uridylyltransferase